MHSSPGRGDSKRGPACRNRTRACTINYIANQEEHHKNQTFQDEFRALLVKHGISFDEKFLWA